MDSQLMSRALKSVLGEGYETTSRMSAPISEHTPSPHDFLQGRVSKDASGADMHVMTSLSPMPRKPKRAKGGLRPITISKREPDGQPGPFERKVGRSLTALGGIAGVAGLGVMGRDLPGKMRAAEGAASLGSDVKGAIAGTRGAFKPIKAAVGAVRTNPRGALRMHQGAMGLEAAALGGDVIANRAMKQHKSPVAKAEDLVTFSKVDEDKRQVFGWCSISKKNGVEVVDLQGDHIPIEEIEKSAYAYMLESRKAGNQHARVYDQMHDAPRHVGDIIESVIYTPEKIEKMGLPEDFTQGWWLGMQIHDEDTWGQIKRGERTSFSIHGKGRREEISKHESIQQRVVDRKEQVKDITLGAAGATAAGAGGASAVLPKIAEHPKMVQRGFLDAARAEKASGKLKVIGAVTGGTAGVYGGLHAAHQAAKRAPLKTIRLKKKPVAKAWSPVARERSLESRRQKRAKGYEVGSAVGAAGVAGGATQQGVKAVRGIQLSNRADLAAENAGKHYFGRNAAAGRLKAEAIRVEGAAIKGRAVVRGRRAGKLGLASAGLAGTAALIHERRNGSWRPYPGVQ